MSTIVYKPEIVEPLERFDGPDPKPEPELEGGGAFAVELGLFESFLLRLPGGPCSFAAGGERFASEHDVVARSLRFVRFVDANGGASVDPSSIQRAFGALVTARTVAMFYPSSGSERQLTAALRQLRRRIGFCE